MSDHIVSAFDNELKSLTARISEMGGKVERMVADSIQALVRMDVIAARQIIVADKEIDNLQREIDEAAVLTIAKRQPMAQDLRVIISCIRISNDLERVGDMAKNIARRVIDIEGQLIKSQLVNGIEYLSELSLSQLKDVLDGFAERDIDIANAVWQRDEQVDEYYTSLFRELLTYMMEDPRNITFCTHLLFCAKNVERIGDHATNIAETIVYLVSGQTMSDPRKKIYEAVGVPVDEVVPQ
ncbi:MAG: phosphate signaling complex protein PhoU [Rhizobiales bacterium]|nr:phosphate signaling complex protein PhoU [Hyphomicrobiales bacterium]